VSPTVPSSSELLESFGLSRIIINTTSSGKNPLIFGKYLGISIGNAKIPSQHLMSNPSQFLNHSVFMIRGCKNPMWLNIYSGASYTHTHTHTHIHIHTHARIYIYRPTVWNALHVKILVPRILSRLVGFGEICAQLLGIIYRPHTTSQTHHLFTCDIAIISGRLSQLQLDWSLITRNPDQTPTRSPAKMTYACPFQSLLPRLLATDFFRIVPPLQSLLTEFDTTQLKQWTCNKII